MSGLDPVATFRIEARDLLEQVELDLLTLAERQDDRETIDGAKQNVSQGALVAIDGTGAIRALVGGRNYADSQFNRAVDAKRQPGSAFKPFVYETALEAGWRPETVVDDAPTKIGNWSPQNYDQRYRGPVMLADALAHSLNTIAAKLTEAVGPKAVIETAARKEVFMMVPVVFLVLPVTVLFAFWPGVIGLSLTTP